MARTTTVDDRERTPAGAGFATALRRAGATVVACAGLAAGLVACSRAPSREGAIELAGGFVREPDLVLDQPGRLVPDATRQWFPFGLEGWSGHTLEPPGAAETCVQTNQPAASWNLPALEPAERQIRLRAWVASPAADSPRHLRAFLNDFELTSEPLVLGTEPGELELHAPREAWRHGANLFRIESERFGEGRWDDVRVAALSYAEERRFSRDASGRPQLPPGVGVVYRCESGEGGHVFLRARPDGGAGTLEVAFRVMSTETGSSDALFAHELATSGGPIDVTMPVRWNEDGAFEIELGWRSKRGATLTLEELAVAPLAPTPRPPVLFVSIDTFAARHLSLYGYPLSTTPELEELARDAVVFERCIANAPWTMPSYLSVMTGLYPRSHLVSGLVPNANLQNDDYWQIAENRWTLAEALRARGYDTAGVIDSPWLGPRFRLDQGFDLYETGPSQIGLEDRTGGIAGIVDLVGGWLDGRAADPRPPFVFVHALDAHGPYWPAAPQRDAFRDELPPKQEWRRVPAKGSYRTNRSIPLWMAATVVASVAPEELARIPDELDVEPIRSRYDEAILETDFHLGRLFDGLRARGLYDGMLIVVTGDHGESFEHDHYEHGELWEDVLCVPLIVKLPGSRLGGTRVDASVQLVDVYPTILDAAGIPPRAHLHGRSLLPLAEAAARDEPLETRPTYSEGGFVRQFMVEDDGWKLIETHPAEESGPGALLTHRRVPDPWLAEHFPELVGRALTDELLAELRGREDFEELLAELRGLVAGPYFELYDLANDPGETTDLSEREPDRAARLRRLLASEQQRRDEARDQAKPSANVPPLDEAAQQALRDLGYAGGK